MILVEPVSVTSITSTVIRKSADLHYCLKILSNNVLILRKLILPSGLVLAVTQAVVFAYYVAYAMMFEEVYGFSQFQVEMAFGALLVGTVLALPVLHFLADSPTKNQGPQPSNPEQLLCPR
jgi:hypothetical protein